MSVGDAGCKPDWALWVQAGWRSVAAYINLGVLVKSASWRKLLNLAEYIQHEP